MLGSRVGSRGLLTLVDVLKGTAEAEGSGLLRNLLARRL